MEILEAVEARLVAVLGQVQARAAVTFVGAEPVGILRLGPDQDDVVHYATVGMSARPMVDPAQAAPDHARGPRAELVLSIRRSGAGPVGRVAAPGSVEVIDTVARRLAVLAMTPFVEGLVVRPGAGLDLGEPLWDGSAFTAVLIGAGGAPVADLALAPPAAAIQFLPVLPMTPAEAAWKRIHGAEALRQRWLHHGVDLLDPHRRAVPLDGSPPRVPV